MKGELKVKEKFITALLPSTSEEVIHSNSQ